jgi:hypothetical protein
LQLPPPRQLHACASFRSWRSRFRRKPGEEEQHLRRAATEGARHSVAVKKFAPVLRELCRIELNVERSLCFGEQTPACTVSRASCSARRLWWSSNMFPSAAASAMFLTCSCSFSSCSCSFSSMSACHSC